MANTTGVRLSGSVPSFFQSFTLRLAMRALSAAVFDADGEVSLGLKRLLAYVVARTHGCHY